MPYKSIPEALFVDLAKIIFMIEIKRLHEGLFIVFVNYHVLFCFPESQSAYITFYHCVSFILPGL